MKTPNLNAIRIRAVIDDVVTSYSDRIHSHKSSWPRMQRCLVQDYFDSTEQGGRAELLFSASGGATAFADTWLISHAMEFNGEGYNLFGGWTMDLADRVERFASFGGKRFSLEREMPDLSALLRGRAEKVEQTTTPSQAAWWENLRVRCAETPVLTHREIMEWTKPIDHVVLGDSHSIAHYQSGALVSRTDGLTLHRLLEDGIYTRLMRVYDKPIRKLTICAGNIDIRHHLLRQSDWREAVDDLINALTSQLIWLAVNGWVTEFEIVEPLPIECAERKIPKTGWYKGTPFYGDVVDRDNVRAYMQEKLFDEWAEAVFQWPEHWYKDPYWYADERMEKPGSVHLSPAYHRWDYENNVPNARLMEEYKC